VFEHIDMLSIRVWWQPYPVIVPTLLGSDFGVLVHLSTQNGVIMSYLRLSHLNLLPVSILDIYKVFEHIDMLSIGIR
jgi:hypothetical protein